MDELDNIPHFATVSYAFCKRLPAGSLHEQSFSRSNSSPLSNEIRPIADSVISALTIANPHDFSKRRIFSFLSLLEILSELTNTILSANMKRVWQPHLTKAEDAVYFAQRLAAANRVICKIPVLMRVYTISNRGMA